MSELKLDYNWADLAFSSKKPWRSRTVMFMLAPRAMSRERLREIIAGYIQSMDVVIGIALENDIVGLEEQGMFGAMRHHYLVDYQNEVAKSESPHKIYSLRYAQRDENHVIKKLKPRKVIAVRGSWHLMFHVRPLYYTLIRHQIPYELVSPYQHTEHAKEQSRLLSEYKPVVLSDGSEQDMFFQVDEISKQSFDYIFQTGCLLATKDSTYHPLVYGYNKVVPYQTYALHHGSAREDNFSPPNDANHYDTIHAEMHMLVKAAKESIPLKGATLFINLLPCPNCARTLSQTELAEVVYQYDHSDGYAAELLQASDIKVRRYIKEEKA